MSLVVSVRCLVSVKQSDRHSCIPSQALTTALTVQQACQLLSKLGGFGVSLSTTPQECSFMPVLLTHRETTQLLLGLLGT